MKPFEVTIPIKTPNPVNGSHRNWRAAAGIRASQKTAALKLIPRLDIEPVVEVRLTRLSAQELDGDNLGPALKAIKDAVAYRLRLDDASRLVRWVEDQAPAPRGEQAVRVSVRWLVESRAAATAEAGVVETCVTRSGYVAPERGDVRRTADEIGRRAEDKMLARLAEPERGEKP